QSSNSAHTIVVSPIAQGTAFSSLFQWHLSPTVTTTLLLAPCAQAQLATMYHLWACPPFKRDGLVVPRPPLPVDYLNLVQLILQWVCSLLLFCIFWAVLACQPQDNWLNLQFTTIMSINEYCIIITVTTVTAFTLQARTTREAQDPSALSRATLLLQAVTFLALALPWFRVQVPQTMREFFRGDYFVL
ncbi:hypothetical protein DL95DRAFT_492198, partial [Leptodontidium sp. 2 PMI_412]